MQEKCYTFIHLGEFPDDEPHIRYITKTKIKKLIKEKHLTYWDYAIIDGPILKSFDSKFSLKDL